MAFENVFRGIDHQAGEKMRMAKQNQFMQALGQAVATQERAQDRDYRDRVLSQKQAELEARQASNYEQIAMDELNRINMGGKPTAQGQAALKVMQQTSAPKMSFDPISGRPIAIPSPWSTMGGTQGINPSAPSPATMAGGDTSVMDAQLDALYQPSGQQVPSTPVMRPDMNTAQQNIDAMNAPAMPMPDMMPDMGQAPTIQAPAGASPKTRQMAEEENIKLRAEFEGLKGAARQKFVMEELDKRLSDESMLPILNEMIKTNRQTLDMPFAELVNAPARIMASDQANAMDSLKQDQLSLAAPLAKMLGTNPTDKDFQASLDQIINLNSTKEGREQQLIKRRDRILRKMDKAPPQKQAPKSSGAVNYMEYFK